MNRKTFLPNIAFFDSGQGGLTVWENVLKRFPQLSTQYMGDNARCPYGNKSGETISRYAAEAAFFLASRNASLIVVACGTVSSVAVNHLQKIYKVPIIGIVEGFCSHVAHTLENQKERTVAVLATRFTIKSQRILEELNKHHINSVWQKACPLFVPLVEEGIASGPLVDSACDMYLWDIPSDVKIVMLACTHYPRIVLPIAESLERRTGRSVILKTLEGDWLLKLGSKSREDPIFLMESSVSIVRDVEDYLHKHDTENILRSGSQQHILCTDSPSQFGEVARIFTKETLNNVELVKIFFEH